VLAEAGDIAGPIADGVVDESVMAAEIGAVILGTEAGRTSPEEITFFKSVGSAVQDISIAGLVLATAERDSLGVLVEV